MNIDIKALSISLKSSPNSILFNLLNMPLSYIRVIIYKNNITMKFKIYG